MIKQTEPETIFLVLPYTQDEDDSLSRSMHRAMRLLFYMHEMLKQYEIKLEEDDADLPDKIRFSLIALLKQGQVDYLELGGAIYDHYNKPEFRKDSGAIRREAVRCFKNLRRHLRLMSMLFGKGDVYDSNDDEVDDDERGGIIGEVDKLMDQEEKSHKTLEQKDEEEYNFIDYDDNSTSNDGKHNENNDDVDSDGEDDDDEGEDDDDDEEEEEEEDDDDDDNNGRKDDDSDYYKMNEFH